MRLGLTDSAGTFNLEKSSMFFLGGTTFPTTGDQLSRALTEGLLPLMTLPSDGTVLNVAGGQYPSFESVAIDLTGARLAANQLPPEAKPGGRGEPGPYAARFQIRGNPLLIRKSPVDLALHASDVRFDYDMDVTGKPLLLLKEARTGKLSLSTEKQHLDELVFIAARDGASRHGVQIVETHLAVTQLAPRSVKAEIQVKGKKLFVTTTLTIGATLTVDDALKAKITDLSITGEGVLGQMVSTALRPKVTSVEGKELSLTAFSLGEVRLRDLRVEIGQTIKLLAEFGS